MKKTLLSVITFSAAAALCLSLAGQTVKAPATKTSNRAGKRAPDGHPDLQGMYDLATLTPVERPSGAPAAYTKERAREIEALLAKQRAYGDQALDKDRAAPPKGGAGPSGKLPLFWDLAGGKVGGYNTGWLDPGSAINVVDGQYRSSIVVDPPDGRVPPTLSSAIRRNAPVAARPTSDQTESTDSDLDRTPGAYDDPERRPLG